MSSLRSGMSWSRTALVTMIGAAATFLLLVAVYLALPRSGTPAISSESSAAPETAVESPSHATVPSPSTSTARPDPTPGPDGLSAADAVAAARGFLRESDRSAEVWATKSGPFADVFPSLALRPPYMNQPTPEEVAADRKVWGVAFKLTIDICGPYGSECYRKEGLNTIFIDFTSGEWLRSSTVAPVPGTPLPTAQF